MNGSGDFLQYTLERSGHGYSVHYATAAVLMLRYMGVPARYVEGYYLSAEDAARYKAGETITLTEEKRPRLGGILCQRCRLCAV